MTFLKSNWLFFTLLLLFSCNKIRWNLDKYAEIQTIGVVNMPNDSAKCNSIIINNGGPYVSMQGICWSTRPNPTIDLTTRTSSKGGFNSYSSNMTGLLANKTYYVRAYAINEVGTAYGNQVIFNKPANTPIVITAELTNNLGNSATLGGYILDDGGLQIQSKGICWAYGYAPNLKYNDGITNDGNGRSQYISRIGGINTSRGLNIYACAYATNSVDTGYGEIKVFYPGSNYYLGQNYGGGLIFYIDNTGSHGLIASPIDQTISLIPWGCSGTNILGATGVGIGFGKSNTDAITAECNETSNAASICKNLVLNGYNDWYLPSEIELNTMYFKLKIMNLGNFQTVNGQQSWYWSSTQADSSTAYIDNFNNGQIRPLIKNGSGNVRAIRAF